MPDDAVFEIGSLTKQFTAAAVLQLAEAGKLDLDADLTEYLPDYNTHGQRIPLRRLLDHTSGIRGYTEMPVFGTLATRRLRRDSLVTLFAAAPLDFAPGEAMIYNNSAYFLLGLIVEQVSGTTYARYVEDHLFAPAGMSRSRYCSNRAVVPRRAHGYDMSPGGLVRARYIDFTWPYAAGSLCSTVRDLLRWNQVLHGNGDGGTMLLTTGYRALVTPGRLNDGTPLRYAMGLASLSHDGRRLIRHGGGIPGFRSALWYYPESDLSIVVLMNTAGPVDPGSVADRVARLRFGDPPARPARAFPGDLADLTGEYRGRGRGRMLRLEVRQDSSGLHVARRGRSAPAVRFIDGTTFALGDTRYTFVLGDRKAVALRVDQVSGLYVLARVMPTDSTRR